MEPIIGFSRACRVGPLIAVAGTAAVDQHGNTVHPGDVYAQTRFCLERSIAAIEQAGGQLEGIIRTRILLRDIKHWQEAARAHGEFFSSLKPACTFAEVASFVSPEWLVETEMDCVV